MSGDVTIKITGDSSEYEVTLKKAEAVSRETAGAIQQSFESIQGAFEKVESIASRFMLVLAGGAALKSVVSSALDWDAGAGKLARTLGVTTEQASIYQVALHHIGVDSDVMATASVKVSQAIRTNGDAFSRLGISIKDANGNYLDAGTVLENTAQKLAAIQNPIQRNQAGVLLLGKSWSEFAPLLKLTAQTMDEARERAEQLGLVVGKDGAAQAGQYKQSLRDVQLVGESLERQLGAALLPVLTAIGAAFSGQGATMAQTFATALQYVSVVAATVWGALQKVGLAIGNLAAATVAFVSGDLKQAKAIWDSYDEDAQRLDEQVSRTWERILHPPKPTEAAPDIQNQDLGGALDQKNQMQAWQERLAEERAAWEQKQTQDGTFQQFSEQQELVFWQHILETERASTSERVELRQKIADLEYSVAKKSSDDELGTLKAAVEGHKNALDAKLRDAEAYAAAVQTRYGGESKEYATAQKEILDIQRAAREQQQKIEDTYTKARDDKELADIASGEARAKQQYEARALSLQQYVTELEQFEQRKYDIKRKALNDELALEQANGGEADPVKLAQINSQLEALEAQHAQAMAGIHRTASTQIAGYYKQVTDVLGNGFANAFRGVINGTQTMAQGMRSIVTSLVDTVVSGAAKMMAQWLVQHALAMIMNKQEAGSNSAVAATGAAKSAAQIPYIGWILAPAAAASVFAMASGYSAAGGFDIPGGVNPVTQLHQREMVLPEHLADRVRAMTDDAGGGDAYHFHIHAVDAKSFSDMLSTHDNVLARAVGDLVSRGKLRAP